MVDSETLWCRTRAGGCRPPVHVFEHRLPPGKAGGIDTIRECDVRHAKPRLAKVAVDAERVILPANEAGGLAGNVGTVCNVEAFRQGDEGRDGLHGWMEAAHDGPDVGKVIRPGVSPLAGIGVAASQGRR